MKSKIRILGIVTIVIVMFAVNAAAQSVQKPQGGTTVSRPPADARVAGQPIEKEWKKILENLNSNIQGKEGGGGGSDTTKCKKFEWKLLQVDIHYLKEVEETDPGSPCLVNAPAVSRSSEIISVTNDFRGTVTVPGNDKPITVAGKSYPPTRPEWLRNVELLLISAATGKIEARTVTDDKGGFRFTNIPVGPKVIFCKDPKGNLFFVANVESCRVIGKDGQTCTDVGFPKPKGPKFPKGEVSFVMLPEIGMAYVGGKRFPKGPPPPPPIK